MLKFSKILLVFLLIVTVFFSSNPAYARSEVIADSNSFQDMEMVKELDTINDSIPKAVTIRHKENPDGYEDTFIINPSVKGARNGAIGGATIGAIACAQTVIATPAAPACALVGAVVGGAIGLIFGS